MRVKINGQWQEFSDAPSVAELLDSKGLPPRRVAIELNREILPRTQYAQTQLTDNDELEIVTLVGGG